MSQDILRIPPPPPGERIAYGSDPLQFGDLRLPDGKGPHPVAIVIHGGFWRAAYDLEHIGHVCAALQQAGIATWSLEYRRVGNPGGGWPGTFQDVALGADDVRKIAAKYNLDLNRVVAVGHSAGGHLALWLGTRKGLPKDSLLYSPDPLSLHGIVSLAGVADLRRAWELKLSNTVVADFLGGSPYEVDDRYRLGSPIERLPLGITQRLIHGTADANVPYDISTNYVSAAKARGDKAELVTLEDAHHFELIDPRTKEFETVKRTVIDLLR